MLQVLSQFVCQGDVVMDGSTLDEGGLVVGYDVGEDGGEPIC